MINDIVLVFKDCRDIDDPCLNAYCPPDEECYIYQPQDCDGCGPTKQCRSVEPPPEEVTDKVVIKYLKSSSQYVFLTETLIFLSIVVCFMM